MFNGINVKKFSNRDLYMITGHIDNLSQNYHKLPEAVQKALDFLQKNDLKNMSPGRYDIEGSNIFTLLQHYNSRNKCECKAETHAKYVDVQFLASGEEYIGYSPYSPSISIIEDNLATKDACFYDLIQHESKLYFNAGTYGVFYPTDIHRPCMYVTKPTKVIKVVVKISIDLL